LIFTPAELADHPFVYLAAAGRLVLSDDEATALRHYLLNGVFLWWMTFGAMTNGTIFYEQIKRVFPDREPVELTLDHRIFHTVFDFKQEPQIPSVGDFLRSHHSMTTAGPISKRAMVAYYAIYDDKQRMMAIICHKQSFRRRLGA